MSDIKTEVIVNGSWRASCDMCFQGIDKDTSSVRVLLLYCLWESTDARACTPLTLDLFCVVQVLVIVNCCMLLIYMHRQTFTTYSLFFSPSFFSSSIDDGETEWDTYVCDNRSFILLALVFFKCSYGRQCDKKNENEQTLIMISFHCHCIYTIRREREKTFTKEKRLTVESRAQVFISSSIGNSIVYDSSVDWFLLDIYF
jgi:hypothetical protein